jgi:CubicO group peptidase (beta-lactamase class C family)
MNNRLNSTVANGTLSGSYDEKFGVVSEEFERNFRERDEFGASVCVMLDGAPVVDLWGGAAWRDTGAAWNSDTLSIVWSSTKGAVSFCPHLLSNRGLLDIDAPVTDYWPEYGQNGKAATTVKMLLNHQSGICAVREKLPDGAYANWDLIVKAVEKQKPFFEPGTAHGYQALTYGWVLGEVIRRVSGQSLGTFFRAVIGDPLALGFWIGLPEEHESRTARMILPEPNPNDPSPFFLAMRDASSVQALALGNSGDYMDLTAEGVRGFDTRTAHAAEIGGAGGLANARGLAGLYAPLACGGSLNGVEYVSADILARMGAVSSASDRDVTLLAPMRFSLGFFKAMDNRRSRPGT